MGKKYLVAVDAPLLAGSAAQHSVGTFGLLHTSRTELLEDRRVALATMASALTSSGNALAATSAITAMAFSAPTPSSVQPSPPLPPSVQVLEGLGSFIVDDTDVDVQTLSGVLGLTVVEDQDIALPDVISQAALATSAPWHLAHVGNHGTGVHSGRDILVGVLDTGIDATHSEFQGKTVHFAEFDALGRNVGGPTRDAASHGTHVCSLIAGSSCGLAPAADLAVAAVLTQPTLTGMSGTLVQIFNGLNWLLTHPFRPGIPGVDVLNASLGGAGYNAYLRAALNNALIAPGVLMIAAIGNAGALGQGRHGSPGNYPEALGVGAIDQGNVVANFSDWGGYTAPPPPTTGPIQKPDFSAPGVNVFGALPGGAFGLKSGTSMASPIVCGVAAQLLEANPGWVGNPPPLRQALENRAAGNPILANPAGNLGGRGQI